MRPCRRSWTAPNVALLRIVAREGVEAGVSAGAAQKYFSTKEDLFRFALDMTSEFLEQCWKTLDQSGNLRLHRPRRRPAVLGRVHPHRLRRTRGNHDAVHLDGPVGRPRPGRPRASEGFAQRTLTPLTPRN
ncbi:HTH-type transcriptional regulator betI [Amycolatopsis decaplanina DSM 44594]|uniref:HTH-type transcriptional regulator betI n=1 Tax=Amycolatopsis decaplanina DSM 44594 TaxID=1284240 RepID=M2YIH6_9PSEU|nr:HTH-type transcriptional regulator betI [Amycolatopsis decaplanina DSM 44594]